jgi:hypothetical protein
MIFNLILYFIFIIFLIFLSYFLYNGSNIFELVTHSNFDYIYTKIDNDLSDIIKEKNPQYIIAENSNNIYKTKVNLYFNSINSEIYFYINNTLYKLNIYNDIAKIIPILINFKNNFQYIPLK